MILADSSVWIDHLHRSDTRLEALLSARQILIHSCVIGELALGSLRQREVMLRNLRRLPSAIHANDAEVLDFIDHHSLFGSGIGYVDAHLLASARLSAAALWTRDKRLHKAVQRLGLAA